MHITNTGLTVGAALVAGLAIFAVSSSSRWIAPPQALAGSKAQAPLNPCLTPTKIIS